MKFTMSKFGATAGFIIFHLIEPAAAQQAMIEDVTSLRATVESVDVGARTVLLRTSDGLVTVEVGPEVKNLPQVRAGDGVNVHLREALVVRVTTVDAAAAPQAASQVLTAEPGQRPAGIRRDAVRANVRITAIDQVSNTV